MWFQLQQNPWLSFDVPGVVVSCFLLADVGNSVQKRVTKKMIKFPVC